MKVLFLTGGSPSTVFGLTPLATAVRNAGHEVFMGTTGELTPYVTGVGLPAVTLSELTRQDFMSKGPAGLPEEMPEDPAQQMRLVGTWYGRLATACLDALDELVKVWRPDVVVGGTLAYAAPVIAARIGVPYVRHLWDTLEWSGYDVGATGQLAPELAGLGIAGLPDPDLWIDVCPPSLQSGDTPQAQLMRWTPANLQRPLEPWMYTRPRGGRVCVTGGSRVTNDEAFDFLGVNGSRLHGLAQTVQGLGKELVIAAPEEVAAKLRQDLGVRAGWIPLDVLTPTCDLLVHNDGGLSSLTGMHAGVPQLCVPKLASAVAPALRLAEYGAAITLLPEDDTPENVVEACRALLSDPSYRRRAQDLVQEIGRSPLPHDIVPMLEKLAAR
ncbi:glycosyltransferase [Streptomyces sp. 21So2-11]|uniref:glycosyltransferase n=1 Tax=Streptomyces sp. 21So2-11 TaxID=3144408 RepID=UPI003219ADF9